MPRISKSKEEKTNEQILHYLFSVSPGLKFTSEIAREIARDEEFTKTLLHDLMKNGVVVKIGKNPSGNQYIRRQRWRLSSNAFEAYSKHQ